MLIRPPNQRSVRELYPLGVGYGTDESAALTVGITKRWISAAGRQPMFEFAEP